MLVGRDIGSAWIRLAILEPVCGVEKKTTPTVFLCNKCLSYSTGVSHDALRTALARIPPRLCVINTVGLVPISLASNRSRMLPD